MSLSKAAEIAEILKLNPAERELFLDLICIEHGKSPRAREAALQRLNKIGDNFFQFDIENFNSIADWYHHAIVELIVFKQKISPVEISESLGLDIGIVHYAIERLLKLGVIEKNDQDDYRAASQNRETTRDVPSEAIKLLNEQILEKASKELRLQDISERDYSISFLSCNKEQMPLAKERIKEFRRSFMKEFESALGKDAVYCMSIQFFELTGNEKR